jgi:tetratricopeptide (TPR) repeat protein
VIENPDKAQDAEAVQLAGVEGVLRTWQAIKTAKPKAKFPLMDELARTAFDLDPSFALARHWLGFALILNGKYDEAISVARQGASDSHAAWVSPVLLAHAYAKQGKNAEVEEQVSLLHELGKTQYVRSYYVASIYATLGDKDKAFAELERSFAERDCYLGRISVDPLMDPLRNDPRYKDLIKRINLESFRNP